jgi:hypothetical protein
MKLITIEQSTYFNTTILPRQLGDLPREIHQSE